MARRAMHKFVSGTELSNPVVQFNKAAKNASPAEDRNCKWFPGPVSNERPTG